MKDKYDPKTLRALKEVEKNNIKLMEENPELLKKCLKRELGDQSMFGVPNWKANGFKTKEDAILNAIKAVEQLEI